MECTRSPWVKPSKIQQIINEVSRRTVYWEYWAQINVICNLMVFVLSDQFPRPMPDLYLHMRGQLDVQSVYRDIFEVFGETMTAKRVTTSVS